jgi:hypothetical protein
MSTPLVSFLAALVDYFPYPKLQGLALLVLVGLVWFLIWSKKKQM